MSRDKRKHTRYPVCWPGRIVLPEGTVASMKIKDVSKGGLSIEFPYALPVNSDVKLEFYVDYRQERVRLLAKGSVVHNQIHSANQGASVGIVFTFMSKENLHTLGNVLHLIEERMAS